MVSEQPGLHSETLPLKKQNKTKKTKNKTKPQIEHHIGTYVNLTCEAIMNVRGLEGKEAS